MANEITTSISFAASKGGGSIATGALSSTLTMTGTFMGGGVMQEIGTSNEVMDIPADVTGDIRIAIKNLSSSNYVEIFKDNADSHRLSKLLAGESCLLVGVAAANLYAKANTAAVNIQFWTCQV